MLGFYFVVLCLVLSVFEGLVRDGIGNSLAICFFMGYLL